MLPHEFAQLMIRKICSRSLWTYAARFDYSTICYVWIIVLLF